jgi:selenide,water dikinase
VQSLDFFPPLVDDPFAFGRIAAANALSDIYAMGGEPLTALNLVGFPDRVLPLDILVEILRGGADAVREAGAVIVGGHTVRDSEIKYGLAVTGRVHPARILTNGGAQPGDKLVLTKPVGTGTLCNAGKNGRVEGSDLAEAIRSMSALNKPGRDAAVAVGVHACTDITGFGLVGHAFEMAEASNVTIVIEAAAVPLFGHTIELARQGVLTRTHKDTQSFLGPRLGIDPDVEPALAAVLTDAQTSGGLLLSVPEQRCAELVAELARMGAQCAAVVGYIAPPEAHRVWLKT